MSDYSYTALLRDTQDGQEYRVSKPYLREDDDWCSALLWLWTEGNYGCDCNRGIFCGLPEPLPCNPEDNRIVLVRLTVNKTGEILWPEGV